MTIDKESLRPAFEAWVVANVREPINTVGRMPSGRYWMTEVQTAWLAYCAAFESLGEPVAYVDVKESVEVPGRPSAKRIRTRSVAAYRIPEVKP